MYFVKYIFKQEKLRRNQNGLCNTYWQYYCSDWLDSFNDDNKICLGGNWGYPYRTTNKPLAIIGWLLIIIGVVIVLVKAKLNGQLV